MHPTLAQALPKLAAQIDTERPLIARAIADHVTIEINADLEQITLHISDQSSYELLTTGSQHTYLRQAFDNHGFRAYSLSTSQEIDPVNPVTTVNDVTTEQRATGIYNTTTGAAVTSLPRTRTILTLPQRAQLLTWVEAHRAEAATKPDTDLATSAAASLGFPVNASHVRTVRAAAGLAKTKPEPLPELSLTDLQKQVTILHIEAAGMKDTIAELRARLRDVLEHLNLPPLSQSGQ